MFRKNDLFHILLHSLKPNTSDFAKSIVGGHYARSNDKITYGRRGTDSHIS